MSNRPTEQEIYTQMWNRDEYREYSPGEFAAPIFLEYIRPSAGAEVLDIGCGTGRGGLMLAVLGQMNVTLMDFAENCLDPDIVPMLETQAHTLRFEQVDISQKIERNAPYGFCCDVMEHIPPERLGRVLDNILMACQHCFFQIAARPDVMGNLIGHALHLSVHPYAWWLERFRERECIIHWSEESEGTCRFYVTAWQEGQSLVDVGVLNTEEQQILENVRINTQPSYGTRAWSWEQVRPYETNDTEVMILGGGPSMTDGTLEISKMRTEGVKLVTLNGAYNWCIEKGLKPSAQIIVDARPFNSRFVQPLVDDCRYLISSQCDPKVLDLLPEDRTLIWHTSAEFIRPVLDAAYEIWYGIPGGSTVLLRAIPLLRMLGFKRFHLFGCDSCLRNTENNEMLHHAYQQTENDSDIVIPVTVGSRVFKCHPWMAAQAREFITLIQVLGSEIELTIHGDGLLAWILAYGGEMEDQRLERKRETFSSDVWNRESKLTRKRRRRM